MVRARNEGVPGSSPGVGFSCICRVCPADETSAPRVGVRKGYAVRLLHTCERSRITARIFSAAQEDPGSWASRRRVALRVALARVCPRDAGRPSAVYRGARAALRHGGGPASRKASPVRAAAPPARRLRAASALARASRVVAQWYEGRRRLIPPEGLPRFAVTSRVTCLAVAVERHDSFGSGSVAVNTETSGGRERRRAAAAPLSGSLPGRSSRAVRRLRLRGSERFRSVAAVRRFTSTSRAVLAQRCSKHAGPTRRPVTRGRLGALAQRTPASSHPSSGSVDPS